MLRQRACHRPRVEGARAQHDAASRNQGAGQDRQATDMRRWHAQQPPILGNPPEIGGVRGLGRQERTARQDGSARRTPRTGRVRNG